MILKHYQSLIAFFVVLNLLSPRLIAISNEKEELNSQAIGAGLIKFSILGNTINDHASIGFCSSAIIIADTLKSAVSNTVSPYIAIVKSGVDYSSAFYSANSAALSIPLRVKVGVTGKYVLVRDSSYIFPAQSCVFLEDISTGTYENFLSGSSYSFTISDTTLAPRFVFHIYSGLNTILNAPTCYYKQNGSAFIKNLPQGNWKVTWSDALNNPLAIHTNVGDCDSLKNLTSGNYFITACDTSHICNTLIDSVFVPSLSPYSIVASITKETCEGLNNGAINLVNVNGGVAPYNYSWSNGSSGMSNLNLPKGVYGLYLKDANNCLDTTYYSVTRVSQLQASFSLNSDTLPLSSPFVQVSNISTAYTDLVWDFGDGATYTNIINPTHTYNTAGSFTVELIASDNICTTKVQQPITITDFTSINEIGKLETIDISYIGNMVDVKFNLQASSKATIKIIDMNGREIISSELEAHYNREFVELNVAAGMYLIMVDTPTIKRTAKVIIH